MPPRCQHLTPEGSPKFPPVHRNASCNTRPVSSYPNVTSLGKYTSIFVIILRFHRTPNPVSVSRVLFWPLVASGYAAGVAIASSLSIPIPIHYHQTDSIICRNPIRITGLGEATCLYTHRHPSTSPPLCPLHASTISRHNAKLGIIGDISCTQDF
jgi:hypothetical protein